MQGLTVPALLLILAAAGQVTLTLASILTAGFIRVGAIKAGRVHIRDIALSNEGWPQEIRAYGNAMNNQFETPTLFYALVALLVITGGAGWVAAVVGWLYVASRLVHWLVMVRGNHVPTRFRVFGFGLVMLTILMALLVIAVFNALGGIAG